MRDNTSLGSARAARNDEFYTGWADIEKEMNAYLEYDPDVFRNKTILLPCDDPEWSNFTKYFALHFQEYGIKKLISTSYAPMANANAAYYEPTLFETESPVYEEDKSLTRGRKFVLEQEDVDGDGRIDIDDLRWEYLEGDGDFRSNEVRALRDEADMVITNPPFSLFSQFVAWLFAGGVKFAIIGNSNGITYRETFPRIQANEMWLGATRHGTGSMWFRVPDSMPEKSGQKVDENGVKYQTIGNSAWFTNIQHGLRHEKLNLMSMEDNKRFGDKEVQANGYPTYDNYYAIEVPRIVAIPSDYDGVMGVPITFLGKYNPEQFEIVGATESEGIGFSGDLFDRTSKVKQAAVNGVRKYKRIFIRHISPEAKN